MTKEFKATFADVDYTGAAEGNGVQVHTEQSFHLFHPRGVKPPSGYPLLIDFRLSGWVTSEKTDTVLRLDPSNRIASVFLERNFAVAVATCTTILEGAYPGDGLWHPPSHASWTDPNQPSAAKDGLMVIQHLRFHADKYDIDPTRIIVYGGSAGGVTMAFPALGPDRASDFGSVGQHTASTRVSAAMLDQAPIWFDMMVQDVSLGTKPPFPMASDPTQQAKRLSEVDQVYKDAFSALLYSRDNPDYPFADKRPPDNSALPVYLYYFQDTDLDGDPVPLDHPKSKEFSANPSVMGTETNWHSCWAGFTFRSEGIADTRLVVDEVVARQASKDPTAPLPHHEILGIRVPDTIQEVKTPRVAIDRTLWMVHEAGIVRYADFRKWTPQPVVVTSTSVGSVQAHIEIEVPTFDPSDRMPIDTPDAGFEFLSPHQHVLTRWTLEDKAGNKLFGNAGYVQVRRKRLAATQLSIPLAGFPETQVALKVGKQYCLKVQLVASGDPLWDSISQESPPTFFKVSGPQPGLAHGEGGELTAGDKLVGGKIQPKIKSRKHK